MYTNAISMSLRIYYFCFVASTIKVGGAYLSGRNFCVGSCRLISPKLRSVFAGYRAPDFDIASAAAVVSYSTPVVWPKRTFVDSVCASLCSAYIWKNCSSIASVSSPLPWYLTEYKLSVSVKICWHLSGAKQRIKVAIKSSYCIFIYTSCKLKLLLLPSTLKLYILFEQFISFSQGR